MKKVFLLFIALWACIGSTRANDGVYFTSGNFLVPIQETSIRAAKERLTITIGADSFATVDVYYELVNDGSAKTVKMAFEAASPYNDIEPLQRNGVHPHIKDFTVQMNGKTLPHGNGVVAFSYGEQQTPDFTPLDLSQWKGIGEVDDSILPASDVIYNPALDSITGYAYAYYFDAPFKEGVNIVHHTYRYRMSYALGNRFSIPYWLTPITRWANHQADDFTLCIKAEKATEMCMADSLFGASPFVSAKGRDIYRLTDEQGNGFIFANIMEDDSLTWHTTAFRPVADMCITPPEWDAEGNLHKYRNNGKVVIDSDGKEYRFLAYCGDSYFAESQDYAMVKKKSARLVNYDAANGQGWLIQNSDDAPRVNVRRRPTTKSPVMCTISDEEGMLPEVYPCLGYVSGSDEGMWYKTKVNGKTGYIRQDLMLWDPVNTY